MSGKNTWTGQRNKTNTIPNIKEFDVFFDANEYLWSMFLRLLLLLCTVLDIPATVERNECMKNVARTDARCSFSIIIVIPIVSQLRQWLVIQINSNADRNVWHAHEHTERYFTHKSIACRPFYGLQCNNNEFTNGHAMQSVWNQRNNHKQNQKPFWINKSLKCHSCCDFIIGFIFYVHSARIGPSISWSVNILCGAMREWDVIVVFNRFNGSMLGFIIHNFFLFIFEWVFRFVISFNFSGSC